MKYDMWFDSNPVYLFLWLTVCMYISNLNLISFVRVRMRMERVFKYQKHTYVRNLFLFDFSHYSKPFVTNQLIKWITMSQ